MSVDERILDVSRRLAREISQAKEQISLDTAKLRGDLDDEKRRLADELAQRRLQVQQERQAIEHERTRMRVVTSEVDDEVLTLNVGGSVFATRRSTICLYEGSYLAMLFSGRWESSIERDAEGRFFLDFDPASFRLVLNFLRSRRVECAGAPAPPPDVPPEREEHFRNLVEYLGLTAQLREAAEAAEAAGRSEVPGPTPSPALGSGLLGSASAILNVLRGGATQSTGRPAALPAPLAAAPASGNRSAPAPPRPAALAVSCDAAPVAATPMPTSHPGNGVGGSSSDSASASIGQESPEESEAAPQRVPGWSKRYAHKLVSVDEDDTRLVAIPDTRSLAAAAAVRGTRGFRTGRHSWQVEVQLCSDWSYIGLVGEAWTSLSNPIGRATHSWSIASNGAAYANREEVKRLRQYGSGSIIRFVVDMDTSDRPLTIVIDGHVFSDVFRALPALLYPAASNCRSAARYAIDYAESESPAANAA